MLFCADSISISWMFCCFAQSIVYSISAFSQRIFSSVFVPFVPWSCTMIIFLFAGMNDVYAAISFLCSRQNANFPS